MTAEAIDKLIRAAEDRLEEIVAISNAEAVLIFGPLQDRLLKLEAAKASSDSLCTDAANLIDELRSEKAALLGDKARLATELAEALRVSFKRQELVDREQAALVEARKDTERLDWSLEHGGFGLSQEHKIALWTRAAIDAAREGE